MTTIRPTPLKFTVVALVLLGLLPPVARAQTAPADAGAVLARPMPAPALPEGATPEAYLQSAAQALAAGRLAEADEAMERAETRALDRSVRPSQANIPDPNKLVHQIAAARGALASGDRAKALQLVQDALHNPGSAGD